MSSEKIPGSLAPDPTPANEPAPAAPLSRQRLSPAPLDPVTGRTDPTRMKPHQQALRQSVVDAFNAKKARSFLQKQVHHINTNRELAEGIRFLFDEHGRSPPNAPLEDVVHERRMIEYHVLWLESVLTEMRHRLVKIREIEDYALEMLSRAPSDE